MIVLSGYAQRNGLSWVIKMKQRKHLLSEKGEESTGYSSDIKVTCSYNRCPCGKNPVIPVCRSALNWVRVRMFRE